MYVIIVVSRVFLNLRHTSRHQMRGANLANRPDKQSGSTCNHNHYIVNRIATSRDSKTESTAGTRRLGRPMLLSVEQVLRILLASAKSAVLSFCVNHCCNETKTASVANGTNK